MTTAPDFTDRFIRFFTSVGYVGYSPLAPGTAGTVVAAAAYWLVRDLGQIWLITGTLMLFLAGVPTSGRAEVMYGVRDSGRIVIDEFVGFWVAMWFLPPKAGYVVVGVVLFRIIDIFKPFGIRKLESRYHGGLGVMIDDVAAGVYTNICIQIFRLALR